MAMAYRMGYDRHHGQRIGTYRYQLCSMGCRVCIQRDNSSVVAAIKKGSAKDKVVVHLLKCFWFFVAHYDIELAPEHMPGVTNASADHLSRCHMQSFFLQNPHASATPAVIHPAIL